MQDQNKAAAIAALNDEFRTSFGEKGNGQIVLTTGIRAFSPQDQVLIFHRIKSFSDFTEEDDPYGEHDFGAVIHEGQKIYFKIDYFDTNTRYASADPADPNLTHRVMTILLASEY